MKKETTSEPEKPLTPVTDLRKLAPDLLGLMVSMLIEGGTIEDVVEALADFGEVKVSPGLVRKFFRDRPDMQQKRIEFLLKSAFKMKAEFTKAQRAHGGTPTLELDLTNAWILTAMQFLNRDDIRYTLRDAVANSLRSENLELKKQMFLRSLEEAKLRNQALSARKDADLERSRLLRLKVAELQQKAQSPGEQSRQELLSKIDEIYGLTAPQAEAGTQI